MQTFSEVLNEGKVTVENTQFMLSVINDNKGLAVQFIPMAKGLEKWGTNETVNKISAAIEKALPELGEDFWYESGHPGAGYVFRLSTTGFSEFLTKKLK